MEYHDNPIGSGIVRRFATVRWPGLKYALALRKAALQTLQSNFRVWVRRGQLLPLAICDP